MKVNGREELFKKKLERTFFWYTAFNRFWYTEADETEWTSVPLLCQMSTICTCPWNSVKCWCCNNQKLILFVAEFWIYLRQSDVYEQYKWLQVPSGYFCFQLIRETAFAIKKEIVFFNWPLVCFVSPSCPLMWCTVWFHSPSSERSKGYCW